MDKCMYVKPSFSEVQIEICDLCVGSQVNTTIDVNIIKDIQEKRTKHYGFSRNKTIKDDMWNPNF